MEILERAFKTIPGLALVFATVALLMLPGTNEIAEAMRVFIVAWILYRSSSALDWLLFDVLYGPYSPPKSPPDEKLNWRKKLSNGVAGIWFSVRVRTLWRYEQLHDTRVSATGQLHLRSFDGLYNAAKAAAIEDGTWAKEFYPPIGYSKAARAFIVPCFVIALLAAHPSRIASGWWGAFNRIQLLSDFAHDFEHAKASLHFLARPQLALLGFACLLAYIALRVVHMIKLYQHAAESGDQSSFRDSEQSVW